MAASIRKAAYFSAHISNRAGTGANMLKALHGEGVNLLAFTGFPADGRAQVDFIPADIADFLRAASKLGLRLGKRKTVFLVQGAARAGAIAAICSKLAAARIGIVAMDAVFAGKGRYGAIFWVKPKDVARASRTLGAR